MEQIIGRAIRYKSHVKLPENRRYVDVFYHGSVLPEYPTFKCKCKKNDLVEVQKVEIDFEKFDLNDYDDMIANELTTGPGTDPLCNCGNSFNNQTIEQVIYKIASKKNILCTSFKNNLIECSIDYTLNKEANISRLEEIEMGDELGYNKVELFDSNKELKSHKENYKLLYNRTKNTYYIYQLNNSALFRATLNDPMGKNTSWPFTKVFMHEELSTNSNEPRNVITDNKNRPMIIINLKETGISFMENPKVNHMNFFELREYAVNTLKEDPDAWKYILDLHVKNQLITKLFKQNKNQINVLKLKRDLNESKNNTNTNMTDIKANKIHQVFRESYEPTDELEFRLGYIDEQNKFKSSLKESFFNNILEKLQHSSVMKMKKTVSIDEIYTSKESFNDKYIKNDKGINHKIKISNYDFKRSESPFDVRVSLNREITVDSIPSSYKKTITRNKERWSFYYKKWRYDLTKVITSGPSGSETSYETEIELLGVPKSDLEETIHSTLYKIDDLDAIVLG
jgi:hypothetical protein